MTFPVTVTFDGVDASDALRDAIVDRAQRLARFAADITACQVVVARDSQHHRQGNAYDIRVKLALPGGDIEARGVGTGMRQADPYAAVADTFDALRRRVEDRTRLRRGAVKSHAG